MPIVLFVVVAAVIVLLAVCAPRLFQQVRGKIAARIQLRDGLAWRGDTPPGAPHGRVDDGRRARVARRQKRPRDRRMAGYDRR